MLLALALTLIAVDDLASAEAAFGRGELVKADEICQRVLRATPGDSDTLLFLGLVRFSRARALEGSGGAPSEVLRTFSSAKRILLEAEARGARNPRIETNRMLAIALMKERDLPAAIVRFTSALVSASNDHRLLYMRGNCYLDTGQYEKAIADFERAEALAPLSLEIRGQHAEALFLAGRGEDARSVFVDLTRRIGSLPPGDERHWKAHYLVYTFCLRLNDVEGGRLPLEKAKEYAPDNLTVRFGLGLLYYRLSEPDLAEPELEFVLSRNANPSQRSRAHHHLGLIHQHRGDLARARTHFEATLAIAPNRAESLQSYGSVLRRLGEKEESRAVLERFRQVVQVENEIRTLENTLLRSPRNRGARLQLIDAMVRLDRKVDARRQLQEFRRYHPKDPAIPELQKRVK